MDSPRDKIIASLEVDKLALQSSLEIQREEIAELEAKTIAEVWHSIPRVNKIKADAIREMLSEVRDRDDYDQTHLLIADVIKYTDNLEKSNERNTNSI
jgi:Asp-tRNA(Asn)/Glu-tRNA(Gln) amidotransferase C subunit